MWLEAATEESFQLLLDVAANPPTWKSQHYPNYWEGTLSEMLGEWARRNPDSAIPKLGSLLHNPAVRPIILSSLYEAGQPSAIPWLKSMVEEWERLTNDELMTFIDALWQTKHRNAVLPLKQLQTLLPPEKTELHKEISLALAHCAKAGVEPGDIPTLKD